MPDSAGLASIPSPGSSSLGPFTYYGLMIALGVIAAVWLAGRRWVARGGHPEDFSAIAFPAVLAGLVGARAYHVLTDWQSYRGRWSDAIFGFQEGGLGIPGGMALGIAVGLWAARRRGMKVRPALDAAAPALPLAQAIGRWGNWFNQELFGRPTDLPWAVEIDPEHCRSNVPVEDQAAFCTEGATFQPAFLYESLWNFALVGVIIYIGRKRVLPVGRLIGVYLLGYGLGRLWIELVRIDNASLILGLRVNVWMSIGLILGGLAVLFWPRGDSGDEAEPDEADNDGADETDSDEADAAADVGADD